MAASQMQSEVQKGCRATLANQTDHTMQLIRSKIWSGTSVPLPPVITSGTMVRIEQLKGEKGCKAGVIYASTTPTGVPGAVVLAWDAPSYFNPTTSPNRVYGVSGPRSVIDNLTWDMIEAQLDKSGSKVEIKGLCATIINNPTTETADLLADFLQAMP
ncbi:hypothetical protein vseg_003103 [Gypsophila vaccaria]